jgi:hypothetical protein
MSQRLLVFVLMTFVAFAAGGCASKSRRNFEEMEMPLQTGSVLHRHVQVPTGPKKKPATTKKKEKEKTPKPEAEPSATPKPEEESTPPPDRFR